MASSSSDLPAGWESRMSESAGKPYYANRALRITQWERPAHASDSAALVSARGGGGGGGPSAAQARSAAAPLPSRPSTSASDRMLREHDDADEALMAQPGVWQAPPGSEKFRKVMVAVNRDMLRTQKKWKKDVNAGIADRQAKEDARRELIPKHQTDRVEGYPNYPYNNFPYKPRGGKWGTSEWPIPGMQGGFMLYRRAPFGESPALIAPFEKTSEQWYPGFNQKREFVYRSRSYADVNGTQIKS